MKRSLALFAAALALALTAAAQSRADIFWYNWTRTVQGVPGQTFFTTVPQTPLNPGDPPHNTVINLQDLNGSAVKAATPTGIPAVDVQVFSDNQDDTNPDWIVAGTGHYHLALDIYNNVVVGSTNTKGPLVGHVSFDGDLEGYANADLADLTNSITSATDPIHGTVVGGQSAQVQVGNTLYTITYSGFAEPGGTSTQNSGAISFHVTATPVIGGGQSPEPSSMVLGFLGLTFLGGVVWRARRRKLSALKAMA